MKKIKANI